MIEIRIEPGVNAKGFNVYVLWNDGERRVGWINKFNHFEPLIDFQRHSSAHRKEIMDAVNLRILANRLIA